VQILLAVVISTFVAAFPADAKAVCDDALMLQQFISEYFGLNGYRSATETQIGIVPSHIPTIMTLMGRIAKSGSCASVAPAMPPVARITLTLAPASVCAAASTNALRAAGRSSTTSSVAGLPCSDRLDLVHVAPE
jgi:hypothetical protein